MRIIVAAVGRDRGDSASAPAQDYRRRLHWPCDVREVDLRRKVPTVAEQRRQEADRLLTMVSDAAVMVALDSYGMMLSSQAFADKLRAWRDERMFPVAFLIGGAEGLDERVLSKADLVLSFGPMTWPHMLVRSLLLEQLYRAQQIIAGHPYHRA